MSAGSGAIGVSGPRCQQASVSTSSATSGSARVDHLPPRFYDAGTTAFARITATRPDASRWIAANHVIYGCAAPITRAGAWKATITATGTTLPGTRHTTQEGQPSSAQLLFPAAPAAGASPQGTALINALWAPEGLPMKIISVPADHDFASPQEAMEALEMAPSVPWHQGAVAARPWTPLEPALPLDPRQIPASVLPDANKTKLVQAWVARENAGHMSEQVQLHWRLVGMQLSAAQSVNQTIARPPYEEHESDYPTLNSRMQAFTTAMNGLRDQEAQRLRPLLALLDDADFHSQLRAAAGRSIGLRAWTLDFCTALTDPLTESELGQQYLIGTMFPGLAGPGTPRQAVHDYYTRIGQGHDMLAWNPDAWVETWRHATHPESSDWETISGWNERISKGLELTSAYLTAQARAQSMLAACFGRTRDLIREEIDHVVGEIFSPVAIARGHSTTVIDGDGNEITTTEPLLGAEHHELEEELEHLEAHYSTFSYDHADASHDTLAQADARSTDQLEHSAQRQEHFAGRAERVLTGLQVLSIVLSLRKLLSADDPPPGEDAWHARDWQRVADWCGVVGSVVQPALHRYATRLAASSATTDALGVTTVSRAAVTAARVETCFGVGIACIALASNIWTFAQDAHNHASQEQLVQDGFGVLASALGVAAMVTPPPVDFCLGIAAFTVGIVTSLTDWFVHDYVPAQIWGEEAVRQGRMRYLAAHATPFYQSGAGRRILVTGIRHRQRGRRYFLELSAPYPYGFGSPLDADGASTLSTMLNGKRLVCILRGETICSLVAFGGVQGARIEPNHHDEYSQEAAERRTIEGAAASQQSCVFAAAAFDAGVASVQLPQALYPCTTWSGSMLGIDGAETMLRRFETELAAQQRAQHHPVSLRIVAEVFEIPSSAASPVALVAGYRYGTPSDDIRLVGRSEPMALVPTNRQTGMNMWGTYALYDPSEVPGADDHAHHEGSTAGGE